MYTIHSHKLLLELNYKVIWEEKLFCDPALETYLRRAIVLKECGDIYQIPIKGDVKILDQRYSNGAK